MDDIFRHLYEITLSLTAKLDRTDALNYVARSARKLTGASIAIVAILDSRDCITEFVSSGLHTEQIKRVPIPFHRAQAFPNISAHDSVINNHIHSDEVHNYLALPILVHTRVWGRLYVANKPSDFTEEDSFALRLLTQATAVAVHNTRLYAQAQSRSHWLTASQNIVASLLEGSEEEDALQVITDEMLKAGHADVAMMVLESINDQWACEFVAGIPGSDARKFLGVTFPPQGRARTVIREQAGIIVDSMQLMPVVRVEALREFGPMLYAPMISSDASPSPGAQGRGVIVLARYPHSSEFDLNDLAMAENVAQQATIALELAQARRTQEIASELDERSRISRDLHDLAIQQLFASGMHITAVREELEKSHPPAIVLQALDTALSAIDESVGQIRAIVQSLRDEGSAVALVDRLEHETKMALQALGFAPSLLITFNGQPVAALDDIAVIDDAVGSDISDDVVAVVREGLSNAARHAHASSVEVNISVTPNKICVCVRDDGSGMLAHHSRRSGLSNLSARARRHHGTFSCHSRTGKVSGAEMLWEVPLH